jgi:menaquinol-cytochrome c reductase iron-sulfur subunit
MSPSEFLQSPYIWNTNSGGFRSRMDPVPTITAPLSPSGGLSRRNFYVAAIYGMGGLIAAALGLPAAVYLLFPPKLKKSDDWVEIGDLTHLTPNSPSELAFRRNRVDGWKVNSEKATAWVVKRPDNSVVAFGPQCTHLGCAYHWDDQKAEFVCPCHASYFSIEGKVLGGPAPRPLDRYETKVEGTRLSVGPLIVPEQQA